ncbi:MAG: GNAT family N-acetyltransferase [Proteobacteria bacterium]|nr:GNAT family N-acetyltransferase [Pseudomonadota bacterium]
MNLVSISPDDPEEKFYEMGDDEIAENTGNFAAKVLPLANGIAQIFHVSDNLLGNLIYLGGDDAMWFYNTIQSDINRQHEIMYVSFKNGVPNGFVQGVIGGQENKICKHYIDTFNYRYVPKLTRVAVINWIYSPEGRGTGTALLTAFFNYMISQGEPCVMLTASNDHQAAVDFYRKHEFGYVHRDGNMRVKFLELNR